MRSQVTRIVARAPAGVTISPALQFDLPSALAPRLRPNRAGREFVGIEDLTLDARPPHPGRHQRDHRLRLLDPERLRPEHHHYHVSVSDSLQCEVRHSTIAYAQGTGSNGRRVLVGTTSSSLFEDTS